MMSDQNKKLYNDFDKLLKNGDEVSLENFLRNNFGKFSEDLKNEITVILLKRALEKIATEDENAIQRFQRVGLDTLKRLEEIKKYLENKKKELKIKKSLDN